MANPFARSKTFHRIGHVTNTSVWRLLPAPAGLAVVTTTGRKTGKRRARAMRVVREGDRAYAVAFLGDRTDWLHNVRSNGEVTVKLGGRTYEAVAREIVEPAERARAAEAYRPVAGWYDYVDYVQYAWGVPAKGALLRAHDRWFEEGTPVLFELKEEM